MAYSNGYNLTAVLDALYMRLGWATDATLNADNKTSNSGRYFDSGFHSIVTVDNVKKTVQSAANWDAYFSEKQKAVIIRSLNSVFNESEFKEQLFL